MDDHSSLKRRLAAILAADIAGYSRLMGEDEAATVRDLKGHQAVVLPLVGRYGGRIIDTAGDGILAEFPSVINATECAVEIQTIMAVRNDAVPESRRMQFRIGINLGDVIHDETRIYGDGINVAARLEGHRGARRHLHLPPGVRPGEPRAQGRFPGARPAHLEEHRASGGRLRHRAGGWRRRSGRDGPQCRRPHAGDSLLHRARRGPARLLDDRPGAADDQDGQLDDPSGIRSREPDLAASLS